MRSAHAACSLASRRRALGSGLALLSVMAPAVGWTQAGVAAPGGPSEAVPSTGEPLLRLATPLSATNRTLQTTDTAASNPAVSGTVRLVPCPAGPQCLQRIADGEADLALVADAAFVMAVHWGQPLELLATLSTTRVPGLIARADRGYVRPAALRGARVGYVHGTSGHYFTDLFLAFHRLTEHVRRVPLDPTRAAQALAAGEVDAAGLLDPWRQQAQALLGDRLAVLPAPFGYTATVNLVARPGLSDTELVPVLRGLLKSVQALPDPGRSPSFRHAMRLDQSLLNLLEAQSRWARREGLVAAGPEPDFLVRMRPGPLAAIDPARVKLVAGGRR